MNPDRLAERDTVPTPLELWERLRTARRSSLDAVFSAGADTIAGSWSLLTSSTDATEAREGEGRKRGPQGGRGPGQRDTNTRLSRRVRVRAERRGHAARMRPRRSVRGLANPQRGAPRHSNMDLVMHRSAVARKLYEWGGGGWGGGGWTPEGDDKYDCYECYAHAHHPHRPHVHRPHTHTPHTHRPHHHSPHSHNPCYGPQGGCGADYMCCAPLKCISYKPVMILQRTFCRLSALLFTAMARIFIPAYCFAAPRQEKPRPPYLF